MEYIEVTLVSPHDYWMSCFSLLDTKTNIRKLTVDRKLFG